MIHPIDISQYNPFVLALAAAIGAVIGSFLTLITYRLPRDEPVGMTRSRCPYCSASLKARDLVPILSWAALRGRCRNCSAKLSWRYPLTELACAAGAVLIVRHYGVTLEALALVGFWWSIVALILTDLEHYIILDEVQIVMAGFGILYAYAAQLSGQDVFVSAATGVVLGLALKYGFLFFMRKDGLGMGDVKFLGVAGIWLADAMRFVPFLFFAGLLGIACGLLWRVLGRGERFPFGPALAIALLVCVLWPQTTDDFWRIYGVLR